MLRALHPGDRFTGSHPVYGRSSGTVERVHKNGSIIGTVTRSESGLTGRHVAFGRDAATAAASRSSDT